MHTNTMEHKMESSTEEKLELS